VTPPVPSDPVTSNSRMPALVFLRVENCAAFGVRVTLSAGGTAPEKQRGQGVWEAVTSGIHIVRTAPGSRRTAGIC